MVQTRRSSIIDDHAGCDEEDSDDSMEDLTIAQRAIRLKERVEALAEDNLFQPMEYFLYILSCINLMN